MRRLIFVAQLACSGLALDVFELNIPEASWDTMELCPPKGALRTEEIKAKHCDYVMANCSFNNSDWASCNVKRKGTASWREMRSKPSFKIKKFELDGDPVKYGDSWSAERVTLNNMVQGTTGPEAYAAFRRAFVIAPESRHVTVMLYRAAFSSGPPPTTCWRLLAMMTSWRNTFQQPTLRCGKLKVASTN